jgi:hypothetical protein
MPAKYFEPCIQIFSHLKLSCHGRREFYRVNVGSSSRQLSIETSWNEFRRRLHFWRHCTIYIHLTALLGCDKMDFGRTRLEVEMFKMDFLWVWRLSVSSILYLTILTFGVLLCSMSSKVASIVGSSSNLYHKSAIYTHSRRIFGWPWQNDTNPVLSTNNLRNTPYLTTLGHCHKIWNLKTLLFLWNAVIFDNGFDFILLLQIIITVFVDCKILGIVF